MTETRLEKWVRTIMTCVMLGFVAVAINQCSSELGTGVGVTVYSGFNNRCELAGGIPMDGLCVSTENLIEVEMSVLEGDSHD